MKLPSLLFFATAVVTTTASCESSRWDRETSTVDNAMVARVSEDARQDISELRAERARMQDQVMLAEEVVQREENMLDIAQAELELAESELEAARDRAGSGAPNAVENVDVAHVHRSWSEELIDYHEARIEWARAQLELAEANYSLSEARLELTKARAVHELEGVQKPDIMVFQLGVEQAKTDVAMAEIDTEAWKRKVETLRSRLDEVAQEVPEDRRRGWRRVAEIEGPLAEGGVQRASYTEDREGESDWFDGRREE